jgi:hypothetical protein
LRLKGFYLKDSQALLRIQPDSSGLSRAQDLHYNLPEGVVLGVGLTCVACSFAAYSLSVTASFLRAEVQVARLLEPAFCREGKNKK